MRHNLNHDPDDGCDPKQEARMFRIAFPELQRKPLIDAGQVAAVIVLAVFLALAVLA